MNEGANWEINVDGKPLSYRDVSEVAFIAARNIKSKRPNSVVVVRDMRNNVSTPVEWKRET